MPDRTSVAPAAVIASQVKRLGSTQAGGWTSERPTQPKPSAAPPPLHLRRASLDQTVILTPPRTEPPPRQLDKTVMLPPIEQWTPPVKREDAGDQHWDSAKTQAWKPKLPPAPKTKRRHLLLVGYAALWISLGITWSHTSAAGPTVPAQPLVQPLAARPPTAIVPKPAAVSSVRPVPKNRPTATPRMAAEALARGDLDQAAAHYASLAAQDPQSAAYRAAARILTAKPKQADPP
ncbi:MAG: hypothetical protein ABW321_04340 [Polyangiales bacterium]